MQILEKILPAMWLKYPTFLVKNDHILFEFFSQELNVTVNDKVDNFTPSNLNPIGY